MHKQHDMKKKSNKKRSSTLKEANTVALQQDNSVYQAAQDIQRWLEL
jgi:hypothetical protein